MNIVIYILLVLALILAFAMSRADMRRRIIPDVYLFPLLFIGLIVVVNFPWISTISDSVTAATFGYALGLGTGWMFEKFSEFRVQSSDKKQLNSEKRNLNPVIGLGDIKLLSVGGIWLGLTGLAMAIVISCLMGGIWGIVKKQKYIPFAPFFIAGGICSLLALSFLV